MRQHDTITEPQLNGPEREPTVRARILVAARMILQDRSLKDLTMEAVAARAGVARRTIYNQFEDRDALYAASRSELLAALDRGPECTVDPRLPLAAGVRALILSAVAVFRSSEAREIMASLERDRAAAPWLEQMYRKRIHLPLVASLELYLLHRRQAGEIPAIDPAQFAASVIEFVSVQSAASECGALSPDELVELVLQRLGRASASETHNDTKYAVLQR